VQKEPVQPEWINYPEAERYSGLSHTTLWRYVGPHG
jgi:predicted DNA-binding transcriptional regulator AlpA